MKSLNWAITRYLYQCVCKTRATATRNHARLFLVLNMVLTDGQCHLKVKTKFGEIKIGFVVSVILSKFQSNLSITNNVITILAKFINLTLKVQGQIQFGILGDLAQSLV